MITQTEKVKSASELLIRNNSKSGLKFCQMLFMKNNIDLPYVARTYWFFRWGVLLIYLSIMVGLIYNYSETIESLRQSNNWIGIGFFLIFVFWFPLGILDMFTAKTVFNENNIETTSQLLIKKCWRYEDIEKVETSNTGHIRITFIDGNSIKVWRGETNLNNILSILKSKNVDSQIAERQVRRSV